MHLSGILQPDPVEASDKHLKAGDEFLAGQGSANAMVPSYAKCEVIAGFFPVKIDFIRIVESGFIPVRRAKS